MNIVEQNITKFVDSLIIDDFSTAHTFLENVINEKIKITIAEEAKKNVEEFVNDLGGFDSIDSIRHGVKQVTSSEAWLTNLYRRQEENKSAPCTTMCSSKSPYMTIHDQVVNRTL
jgi:hypothetical protein